MDATPYINHPLTVASILTEAGVDDPDVIIAALLHDTVEDTETSPQEIADRFGERVASMVAEVTDDKSLPPAERKRLQISNAVKKSHGAKLVKLADKISNLLDLLSAPPADWSAERKLEYFHWAKHVVSGLRGSSANLELACDEAYEQGLRGK